MNITKTKAKRLIKQALKKLEKKGQSDGSIPVGKYIIDITASGALGFEGIIEEKSTKMVLINFEYNFLKNKYSFE